VLQRVPASVVSMAIQCWNYDDLSRASWYGMRHGGLHCMTSAQLRAGCGSGERDEGRHGLQRRVHLRDGQCGPGQQLKLTDDDIR
jgi:hypothetical protein